MFVPILLIALLFSCLVSTKPIDLTDKTWKNMLTGQWMVEFYAPWCSACQKFEPIWNDFSAAMSSKNIKVAAIDIDQNPSLSGRFRITALPTVYYVRDGVFRQFDGERSLKFLRNYIEHEDWQNTEPIPSYLAPDSLLMSLTGSTSGISLLITEASTLLQDRLGLPTPLIYIIVSAALIILGIASGYSILSLINSFLARVTNVHPTAVPSDQTDSEKVLKSNEQIMMRPLSEEVIIEDENDNLEEATDEQKASTESDQTVRQRQLKE